MHCCDIRQATVSSELSTDRDIYLGISLKANSYNEILPCCSVATENGVDDSEIATLHNTAATKNQ